MEIVGGGTLITESLLARAELNAKWLLIDFGERSATRAAAREKLMMANVGFNGTHQKIVFDVTDRFYQLGTARQKVLVTQSALDASKTVEQAAQTRFDNGLATKPELLQAEQQSAQSNFDLQASLGAESDASVGSDRKHRASADGATQGRGLCQGRVVWMLRRKILLVN